MEQTITTTTRAVVEFNGDVVIPEGTELSGAWVARSLNGIVREAIEAELKRLGMRPRSVIAAIVERGEAHGEAPLEIVDAGHLPVLADPGAVGSVVGVAEPPQPPRG